MPKRTFAAATGVIVPTGTRYVSAARRARTTGPSSVVIPTVRGRVAKGFTRRVGFYKRFQPGGEAKFFDTAKSISTVSTSGEIHSLSLNLVPQGVTENTRVGRKCVVKSLQMRCQIQLPEAANDTSSSDAIRIIVYVDKQTNGATAAVTDILESATNAIRQPRDLANTGRFRILTDKLMNISASAAGGGDTTIFTAFQHRHFNLFYRLNVPLEFSSTTGAITELKSNNIGVLAASAFGFVGLGYIARIRFTDQ